jgi:hypothetical protein
LGFLPWFAPFLLRSRRLRARFDMLDPPSVRGMHRSSHVVS